MPIATVKAPTGETIEFYVPEGTTEAEATASAGSAYELKRMGVDIMKPTPYSHTLGGYAKEFGKGFLSGAEGLFDTAAVGLNYLLPEEQQKAVRGTIDPVHEAIQKALAPDRPYRGSIVRGTGEALGSTVPFVATALLPGAGEAVAGTLLGGAAGAGEAGQRAEAAGATREQINQAAAMGIGPGLLDTAVPGHIVRATKAARVANTLESALGREVATGIKDRALRVAITGGEEGAQEYVQQVAQNLIAQGIYDPNTGTFADTGENFGYGAGVGALMQALAEFAIPGRVRGRRGALTTGEESDLGLEGELLGRQQPGISGLLSRPTNTIEGETITDPEQPPPPPPAKATDTTPDLSDDALHARIVASLNAKRQELDAKEQADMRELEQTKQAQEQAAKEFLTRTSPPAEATDTTPNLSDDADMRAFEAQNEIAEQFFQKLLREQAAKEQAAKEQAAKEQADMRELEQTKQAQEQAAKELLTRTSPPAKATDTAPDLSDDADMRAFEAQNEINEQFFQKLLREQAAQAAKELLTRRPPPAKATDTAPDLSDDADMQEAEAQGRTAPGQSQMEFPAIPAADTTVQGIAEETRSPAAKPKPRIVTDELLDDLEFPRNPEWLRKRLLGQDVSSPDVQTVFSNLAQNHQIANNVKIKFNNLIQDIPKTQGDLFASKKSTAKAEKPNVPKAPEAVQAKEKEQPVGQETPADNVDTDTTGAASTTPKPEVKSTAGQKAQNRIAAKREADAAAKAERLALIARTAENNKKKKKPDVKDTEETAKPKAKAEPEVEADSTEADYVVDNAGNDTDADVARAERESQKTRKDKNKSTADDAAERVQNTAKDADSISRVKKDSPEGKYFYGKKGVKGLQEGLDKLAGDIATKKAGAREAYAWAKKNLTKESHAFIGEQVRAYQAALSPLLARATAKASVPLTDEIRAAIQENNLAKALDHLAASTDPTIAKVAAALRKGIGKTEIRFESGLKNEAGEVVAGFYDPKTDTILLNPDVPLPNHILLHEVTHAVTSHELSNPSSPYTRQLQKLFDSVKGRLDTAYGATNLEEFVAEAFSNPEFQDKLAQMTAEGETISFFDKLKNIIRNIVRKLRGLPSENLETAKDAVDSILADMISPAPETRDGAKLYAAAAQSTGPAAKNTLDSLGRFVRDKVAPEDLAYANGWLSTANSKSRRTALSFLPLNAIADLIKTDLPQMHAVAVSLFKTIQAKSGMRSEYMLKIRDTAAELDKVFKGRPEAKKVFNDVIAESTLNGVDPSKPRPTDKTKGAVWDTLQKNYWGKMSAADKKAYTTLRDAYAKVYDDLYTTMEKRIDEMDADKSIKELFRNKILLQLLQKESIKPYFPLYRKGDYWLTYRAFNEATGTVELYKESFESIAQRDKARVLIENDAEIAKGLKKAGQDQEIISQDRVDENRRRGNPIVDSSFAYSLLGDVRRKADAQIESIRKRTIEKALADGKTQQQAEAEAETMVTATKKAQKNLEGTVLEALLDAMPERSLARAFKSREGVLGFERDAVKVFRERMPNFVSQVTNIKFDNELSRATRDIQDAKVAEGGSKGSVSYAADVAESLNGYIDFVRNPQIASWARALRSASFGMTLGFNVSSALVNISNVPLVVLPYLGGKHGYGRTMKAINLARKLYFQTGTKRKLQGFTDSIGGDTLGGPSLTNFDYDKIDSVPKELRHYKQLAEMLNARGQANRSAVSDALDFDNASNTTWDKVNALMGGLFHQAERLNRHVTAMAAYDLFLEDASKGGKKMTEKDYQAAAEYALESTELTNSGAQSETGPRISQTSLGSVVMMYKRFGISMYYLQFKMAREALRDASPEVRSQAKRQIIGIFASAGLLAGVQGLPMMGAILALANMFLLDDEDDDAASIAEDFFGTGMYNGVVNAVTGWDVAPRISMTDLLYRSQPNKEQDSLILQAFETVGGPAYSTLDRMLSGAKLVADGEVERGAEKMLPSALSNMGKSARYAITGGADTLRGDPVVQDIGPMSEFGQLFGFSPAGFIRQTEINARDKRVDKNITKERSKLLKSYYMASRNNDTDEMADLMGKMMTFSMRFPEVAIGGKNISASMKQFERNTAEAQQLSGAIVSRKRAATVMLKRAEEQGD